MLNKYRLFPMKVSHRRPYPTTVRRPFNVPSGCVLFLAPEVRNRWTDYSGKGNHGAISGASKTSGRFAEGLLFDGINDYVNCGNKASLNITNKITIEAWVKVLGPPSNEGGWGGGIVSKSAEYTGYLLVYGMIGENKYRFYIGTEFVIYTPPSGFNHIVGTYDGQNIKLYLNGQLVDATSRAGAIPSNSGDVLIGESRYDYKGTRTFNGLIDEVRIYNRALSKDEIRTLYDIEKLIR